MYDDGHGLVHETDAAAVERLGAVSGAFWRDVAGMYPVVDDRNGYIVGTFRRPVL